VFAIGVRRSVSMRCDGFIHNMFLSGTDFWRYLDKAYSSVPGSGGSIHLHAIPRVHRLTRTLFIFQKALIAGLPAAAVDSKDCRRQTESLLRLRLSSCLLYVNQGRLDSHMASRRLESAQPWRSFRLSAASSNTCTPPRIRPYSPSLHTLLIYMPHPPKWDVIK
jgi:hypothetical protein